MPKYLACLCMSLIDVPPEKFGVLIRFVSRPILSHDVHVRVDRNFFRYESRELLSSGEPTRHDEMPDEEA
ncbi:MAG: hypothetical protein JW941_04700, partial [Candidatus Coatesbacteria bacterium]|nr:hypothetical protein [Candidatus Coatesbacteria bacterium]